ncbi:MAG TPA: sialidase family protein [Thermoanaerobaculia bacterium]
MRAPGRLRLTFLALFLSAAAAVPALAVDPTYGVYPAPSPLGTNAGEPSLGVDWKTGKVMFQAGLQTLRVSFDDTVSPATAFWQDVSYTLTSLATLDPILYVDRQTGRTFVSQLAGVTSLMAVSDDDGASWTPSQGSGIPSGVDHQTVSGGAPAAGLLPAVIAALYPHTVYYCSQDVALALCAESPDGGLTFGVGVPIYTILSCGGLHGHLKVAPDGTVYVPNKSCGSGQGMAVSTNNGLTWTVRTVPGSTSGSSDPSIGIATDGTVYFGYGDASSHPRIAVSHDRGVTWSASQDVGVPFGIQNTVFPEVVAGDPNRAAFAFLGTPTAGADGTGENPSFPGEWHLYIATTYDGGGTWTTVDATPADPVQRGSICTAGTTCGSTRNLLDFMDIAVDAQGRVVVAFADGCVGSCVSAGGASTAALATIARQTGGKRLFAAFGG